MVIRTPVAHEQHSTWNWSDTWTFDLPAQSRSRPHPRRRRPSQVHAIRPALLVAIAAASLTAGAWAGSPQARHSSGRLAEAPAHGLTAHPSAYALATISPRYLRIYIRVGAEYDLDWSKLAAVGEIESEHGTSPQAGVQAGTNTSGAAGPAQFLLSTWARYGVDVQARGRPNPYDPLDAITSMAAYLKASGAPQDWRAALFAYNHSTRYVDEVLALGRRLRQGRTG